MEINITNASTLIDGRSGQKVTLWRDYLTLCGNSRSPACAAAILDLFERLTLSRLQLRVADLWIPLTYETIYDLLFENYWLSSIKYHTEWLQNVGYIECRLHPNDENAQHAFRLNIPNIERAIQAMI